MSSTPLAGRLVALVAFPRELFIDATSALERAGAEWQALSSGAAPPANASLVVTTPAVDAGRFRGPVLVVGSLEDISRADLPAGVEFVVGPPLRGDELVLRAAHVLEMQARQRMRRAPAETPVVVAADDDPTTTAIVRAVVSQNAMICHTAADGKTALELVRRHRPGVVVLDVNMPFLGGFEVLAAIRNDSEISATPVVMLTSVQQESDVVRAFSLGADDYVVKPFNPMELLARLKRIVRKAV